MTVAKLRAVLAEFPDADPVYYRSDEMGGYYQLGEVVTRLCDPRTGKVYREDAGSAVPKDARRVVVMCST